MREVIGRRLDRLSERCNETLTIASVIGREFTLEHLQQRVERDAQQPVFAADRKPTGGVRRHLGKGLVEQHAALDDTHLAGYDFPTPGKSYTAKSLNVGGVESRSTICTRLARSLGPSEKVSPKSTKNSFPRNATGN